jgi:hypothetical protein
LQELPAAGHTLEFSLFIGCTAEYHRTTVPATVATGTMDFN